eukprot:scaffold10482_cov116-Isochrysis_galbana.AAC.3
MEEAGKREEKGREGGKERGTEGHGGQGYIARTSNQRRGKERRSMDRTIESASPSVSVSLIFHIAVYQSGPGWPAPIDIGEGIH